MRQSLISLIKEESPDKIGIEFPIFGDLWSEGMYGLFLFCCEAVFLSRVDLVFWSPLQVKSWARESLSRPKGWKMAKPDMVEAARWDTRTEGQVSGKWNHNEADAYLIAALSGKFWLLQENLLKRRICLQ